MKRLIYFIEDWFNPWKEKDLFISKSRVTYELRRHMDRHDKNEGDLEGIRQRYRQRGSFKVTGTIVSIGSRYKEEVERG